MSPAAPLAVIVTGLPCTGKTHLARCLASRFALPLACKDEYKELLFDTLGWGEREWSRKLSQAAEAALRHFLAAHARAGQSCLIESNFAPSAADALLAIQQLDPFRPFQIVCRAEGEVLLARFVARTGQRHPGHGDEELLEELAPALLAADYAPLAIGGALWELDTSNPEEMDLEPLFCAIEVALGLPISP